MWVWFINNVEIDQHNTVVTDITLQYLSLICRTFLLQEKNGFYVDVIEKMVATIAADVSTCAQSLEKYFIILSMTTSQNGFP